MTINWRPNSFKHDSRARGRGQGRHPQGRVETPCVLVSTSLMGRGCRFPQVRWLINYDMPPSIPEYLHRLRYGGCRAGGVVMTLLTQPDLVQAPELVRMMTAAKKRPPALLQQAANNYMAFLEREDPEEAEKIARRDFRRNVWQQRQSHFFFFERRRLCVGRLHHPACSSSPNPVSCIFDAWATDRWSGDCTKEKAS
jgi:superfamily II DNA/RNA helicase